MPQLAFTYKASTAGHEGWVLMLDAIRSAVAYLGQKEVCFELDVARSTLSEALGEKNDKRWAGEWTCKVLAMLSMRGDDECARMGRSILAAQAALMPCFAIVNADDMPTPAEVAAAKKVIEKAERRAA